MSCHASFAYLFCLRIPQKETKEEDRHMFGVCFNLSPKMMDFSDTLVDWLEKLKSLGVAKVMGYTLQVLIVPLHVYNIHANNFWTTFLYLGLKIFVSN